LHNDRVRGGEAGDGVPLDVDFVGEIGLENEFVVIEFDDVSGEMIAVLEDDLVGRYGYDKKERKAKEAKDFHAAPH
jgi:hypothetical protein